MKNFDLEKKKKWREKMRKKIFTVMMASVMVLSLAACGNKETSNSADSSGETTAAGESSSAANEELSGETIQFWGVNDPQISAQQIIADELGYFKDEGVNVDFEFLQTGTDMNSLMAGGTAVICAEAQYQTTSLKSNGVDFTILAPLANCGGTQCVVAGPKTNITESSQLEGATIAMSNGAGVNMAVKSMCEATGVDYDSIKWVYCDPSEQLAALMKGDVDAMACWEPYCSQAVAQGGKLLFNGIHSYLSDCEGDVAWMAFYSTLHCNDAFLKTHRGDVVAIMKALSRATDYINENRDEAVKIIAKAVQTDEDTVKMIMSENEYSMEWDDAFSEGIDAYAKYMYDSGNISKIPEYESYTDTSLLSEVDKSLVTTSK